jgi:uncharacterized protein (DUF4415 family)
MKKVSASSRPEKRRVTKKSSTEPAGRTITMRLSDLTPEMDAKIAEQMKALASLPDDQIDTSDIPELPASAWKNAIRGRFYRPVKKAVSMRLDTEVVEWLKQQGPGYQTRANSILRERMLSEVPKRKKSA